MMLLLFDLLLKLEQMDYKILHEKITRSLTEGKL